MWSTPDSLSWVFKQSWQSKTVNRHFEMPVRFKLSILLIFKFWFKHPKQQRNLTSSPGGSGCLWIQPSSTRLCTSRNQLSCNGNEIFSVHATLIKDYQQVWFFLPKLLLPRSSQLNKHFSNSTDCASNYRSIWRLCKNTACVPHALLSCCRCPWQSFRPLPRL